MEDNSNLIASVLQVYGRLYLQLTVRGKYGLDSSLFYLFIEYFTEEEYLLADVRTEKIRKEIEIEARTALVVQSVTESIGSSTRGKIEM